MQKVIYRSEIENYTQQMESVVVKYIEEGQIETFEGFDNFSIIAFDCMTSRIWRLILPRCCYILIRMTCL